MRGDTRHKIYIGSGCFGGDPYDLFEGSSMVPCAWCWVGQVVLLAPRFLVNYKVVVLVGSHGMSPNMITVEFQ
jgi:hypothetical protein